MKKKPQFITDVNETICLIPVIANPPTYGMVMSIFAVEHDYDKIILCILDKPSILTTEQVANLLACVFREPKYDIISHPWNFVEIGDLPGDLPRFTHIATLSHRVYVNLTSRGYHAAMLPKPIGFHDCFERRAYQQGQALDYIKQSARVINIKDWRNKVSCSREGGDDE